MFERNRVPEMPERFSRDSFAENILGPRGSSRFRPNGKKQGKGENGKKGKKGKGEKGVVFLDETCRRDV